mmetsp:Transcript_65950/g.116811  ORF Transcript_65950/g.116811 Transcript_65950/m.116811 type:complete len:347 (-) Transcript_65950:77-1117(-)
MSNRLLWSEQGEQKLADESSLEVEDEDSIGLELPAKEMDLPKDVWTQALLGVLLFQDKHDTPLTCDERLWFMMSLVLYFTNMVLQIGIITMILVYVVDPMEAETKPPIFDMNAAAELLNDPRLQGHPLEGSQSYQLASEKAELVLSKCKSLDVPGLFRSQLGMLFLWNARIVKELAAIIHIGHHLRHCERRTSAEQQLLEDSALVRVDSYVLCLSHILVQLPKWAIGLLLWFIGSELIIFGTAPFKVVLKGLALQFLVSIDELLYEAFAGPETLQRLAKFRVRYQRAESPKWDSWGSTVFKFCLAVGVTAFTMFVQFGDLPNFRSACNTYEAHAPETVLDKMHWHR